MLKIASPLALSSGARLAALAAQFGVILVLARVLEKDEFGNAMLAFGLYRFISMGLGTGLGNLILYRVSHAGGDSRVELELTRAVTLVAISIGLFVTLLLALGSGTISSLFQKAQLEFWLIHLSPMLLFGILNLVSTGALDGRSQITKAIALYELAPNLLRVVCIFAASLLTTYSGPAIALALWAPMAIPWLLENKRLLDRAFPGVSIITKWDAKYAGYLSVNSWASQQLQGADIIIVGYLFEPNIVADYAMASRFASLFPFFQFLMVRNFTPKLGLLISKRDISAIHQTLSTLRLQTIISVCALTACIIICLPLALSFAGSFPLAPHIVAALALPAVLRSAFSGTDVVMRMTGKAAIAAFASTLGVLTLFLVPLFTHDALGIYSVPTSMLIYAIYINIVLYLVIYRMGIEVVSIYDLASIAPALLCMFLAVIYTEDKFSVLISAFGLILTTIICVIRLNIDRRAVKAR